MLRTLQDCAVAWSASACTGPRTRQSAGRWRLLMLLMLPLPQLELLLPLLLHHARGPGWTPA